MFLVSGGENFWKTLWIVVLFVVFIVPNLEYIRSLWGYATGETASAIQSQNWEDKKPLDTVYAFLRKQERNAYYAQYDSMVDSYRELSMSARRLSDIPMINHDMKEKNIIPLFNRASVAVKKYMTDQKAEYVTEAKGYLGRIEDVLRSITKPWMIGWLVGVSLIALAIGLRQKRNEDDDMEGLSSDMIQRSRVGLVRSYLIPAFLVSLWYFMQFDPFFTMFGFYFMVPMTFIWFFLPYVMSKSAV